MAHRVYIVDAGKVEQPKTTSLQLYPVASVGRISHRRSIEKEGAMFGIPKGRLVRICFVAFFSAGVAVALCTNAFAQGKGETVVGAPVTPARLTDIQPEKPYRQIVAGLLARTVYVSEGTSRHRLEFWDVMVGPGKTSEATQLPGSGVIDVRSGSGSLHSTGDAQRLRTGSMLAFENGSSLSFVNDSQDEPLILRVTLIRNLTR